MKASDDSTSASARSPFAGCAILIAAVLVMVFLIGFSTLTLFRQFNEIAKFTGEKPVPVELVPIDEEAAALNQLAERIEIFRQQLDGDQEATLELSAADMNLAIAAYDAFKDLRGNFRVASIEGGKLRIAISFQLNGKPRLAREGESGWLTSDARYLNGVLVATPGLLKREVVLKLSGIEVPNATVPIEFVEQMSPYRITERYLADPVLGPAMAKLTNVGVEDEKIVFSRVPGEVPADVIGKDQVDAASNRFFTVLAIAACVFLLFAGSVVVLGLRAKRDRP